MNPEQQTLYELFDTLWSHDGFGDCTADFIESCVDVLSPELAEVDPKKVAALLREYVLAGLQQSQ